jgi:autotransporter-associated beta strand protein
MICRFVFMISSASATLRTWTGAGGSSYWSASANWSPAGSPVSGDELIFHGGASRLVNTNDLPNLQLNSIVLNGSSGGFFLFGNPVSLDSSITDTHTGVPNTVDLDFQLTSSGSVDVNSAGVLLVSGNITANNEFDLVSLTYDNLTITGTIHGNCSLVKIGDGSAALGGSTPNSYTGPTYVRGGRLHLSKNGTTRTAVSHQIFVGDGTLVASELYEDLSGQLPLDSDVTISTNGTWFVNFDSTVTNLHLLSGGIEGIGTLHLRGDCRAEAGASHNGGEIDIGCNIDLESQTRTIDMTETCVIRFEGAISGDTGAGLNLSGAGNQSFGGGWVYLDNTNTFSGPLEISSYCDCNAYYNESLGGGDSPLILSSHAILRLSHYYPSTVLRPIICYDGGYIQLGPQATFKGAIATIGDLTISPPDVNSHNVLIESELTGSGNITLGGAQFQLSGSQSSPFDGTIELTPGGVTNSTLTLAKSSGATAFAGTLLVHSLCTVIWSTDLQIPGANIIATAGATFDFANHSETPAKITFEGGGSFQNVKYLSAAGGIRAITNNLGGGGLATINGNLSFLGNLTFNISNSVTQPALELSGSITGTGSIVKNGPGSMRIVSAGSFSGGVTLNEGTLIAGNNTALGSASPGTTVKDGATLELDGISSTFIETLHLAGNGAFGTNGALLCKAASTISSSIVLDAPATIRNEDTGAPLVLQSTISGIGPLTKIGAGTVELAGSSANTYSGDTLANEGSLWLSKPNGIIAVPGNLTIGTRVGNLGGGTAATVAYFQNDAIAGTNVIVNGGSLYNLNNYNESLGSVTLNNGGSIQTGLGQLGFIGSGSTTRVTVNPGNSGASTIAGRLMILFGGTFNVASRLSALVTAPELDITASISDSITGNFLKTGAGRMRLSASNSFNAGLTVDQGTLMVSNKFALGTTAGGTSVTGTGKLSLDGGVSIANEPLMLNSSNTFALESVSGSNTWAAPIVLSGSSTINVASGYLQVLNTVSGTGSLAKLGAGTLQFWGSVSNTYTGPTIVSAGILEAGRISQLSVSTNIIIGDNSTSGTLATLRLLRDQQLGASANVLINSSGKLDLYNFPTVPAPNQTLRTLEGAGVVSLSRADSKLTVSNDISFNFDGTIIGSGLFTKIGAATMANSGIWNLTSTADIVDGTFAANGTVYNDVHVHNSARLQGDGQVLAKVTVDAGGVVSANSKFPDHQGGELQITDLEMQPGGVISLSILGPDPTAGNDSLTLQTANITNATLSTGFGYPPCAGDVVVQLNKTSAGPIGGMFSGFVQGVPKTLGNYTVIPSYTGGSGNDFTLTVTNLAGGFAGYRLAEGNGNQTVEPDECNLLYVGLLNQRGIPLVVTSAVLRATTADALVTVASATYPTIDAGLTANNLTPFQFRTTPDLPCGMFVGFELVIGAQNEGLFAMDFIVGGGTDCSHPTGPCESCNVVTGQFTTNTSTTVFPLNFIGSCSVCYPPKAFPGIDPSTNLPPVPYITHSFTNSTTNTVYLTIQLDPACPGTPTNAFGVAAYLGTFIPDHPEFGYLGDNGDGYPSFSIQVPAGSNIVAVVMARATNLVCDHYTLEVFGLPCAPPVLAIEPEPAASKVRVDWSTAYPGWTPQQTRALNQSFSDVLLPAAIVNGRYTLTNFTAVTNQFYRLKNQ